jgi:hypothetical protein
MSDIDDIDGEDGVGADGLTPGPDALSDAAMIGAAAGAHACLSCGHPIHGVFCTWCGQKNDDMRRSLFLLARNFLEDTFSFDSRMWRTLGQLAISPGTVPKDYSHGRRSQFTPPVRLFLVVSFLFFLTVAMTNTLFMALEVEFKDDPAETAAAIPSNVVVAHENSDRCNFQASFRFFMEESDIHTDLDRLNECMGNVRQTVVEEINDPERLQGEDLESVQEELDKAGEAVERAFGGVNWAASNPRAFNDAFNDWMPRVLFLMTPVLALILAMFFRGKDALIFDHMVLSLYVHAAGFVIVGASLILTQLGAPYMGLVASGAVAIYYLAALKRAYHRGWIKTVWTAVMSGFLYLMVFLTILMVIVSNIVWNAAA